MKKFLQKTFVSRWPAIKAKRTLYTANFVFFFRSQVPNDLIPINPLGLTITYFREDEAFN